LNAAKTLQERAGDLIRLYPGARVDGAILAREFKKRKIHNKKIIYSKVAESI
jgi:hypothetical protein